jgi:hypothetical protein
VGRRSSRGIFPSTIPPSPLNFWTRPASRWSNTSPASPASRSICRSIHKAARSSTRKRSPTRPFTAKSSPHAWHRNPRARRTRGRALGRLRRTRLSGPARATDPAPGQRARHHHRPGLLQRKDIGGSALPPAAEGARQGQRDLRGVRHGLRGLRQRYSAADVSRSSRPSLAPS